MERVTGLGGIFFKARDPKALAAWYQTHLGIDFGDQLYVSFKWINPHHPTEPGQTAFSFFKNDTKYFQPSDKDFMINFRVKNLKELVAGCYYSKSCQLPIACYVESSSIFSCLLPIAYCLF